MSELRSLLTTIAIVINLFSITAAQNIGQPERARDEMPLVTAAATAERVRIAAPSEVVQLRLEVYSEFGNKVFDSEQRGGNLLDWNLQSETGRIADGLYLCVVTVKPLTGEPVQRLALVAVTAEGATLRRAEPTQMSVAQAQAISSIEESAALSFLEPSETPAVTVVAHTGTEGQLARTRGPLSFRVGDVLTGQDREQMRITSDGRVGIGTSKPQATLDVAGEIHARGIKFDDGTVLTTATGAGKTGPDGTSPLLVDGTGTTNRVTKWTNGPAGTLGDSALTEVNGRVGLGTASPNFNFSIFGNDVGVQLISPTTGAAAGDGFRFGIDSTNKAFLFNQEPTDMYFGTSGNERMRILSSGNVGIGTSAPTAKLSVSGSGAFNAAGAARFDLFNTTANVGFFQHVFNDGRWQLGTGSSTRLLVDTVGNLGVGTGPAAAHKLDVAGVINSATQYNIRGGKVLSIGVANSLNTFAGLGAGASTTGGGNSFFGDATGQSNTTGNNNSFFGRGAGVTNTTGSQNSLFGAFANSANGLTNATAVGFNAFVEQSNSLVLGSVAGKNGALTDTNVGIGTTAPTAKLTVAGAGAFNATGAARFDLFNTTANAGFSQHVLNDGRWQLAAGANTRMLVGTTGNVGIGTTGPVAKLHVNDQQTTGTGFHDEALRVTMAGSLGAGVVARFENTSTDTRADVLQLNVGVFDNPTHENNYITFLHGDDDSVGAIEGNGSGGISFVSGSADYAEWLPRLNPAEQMQPGEIVGLVEGRITKNTRAAVQMMAVSTGPIILGNDPGEKERANYEKVAFIGQVMVRVRGAVKAGDYIVASGLNDGTGVAVSPERITSEQFEQAVGEAWESSADLGLKSVRTAVGLLRRDPTVARLMDANRKQAKQIKALSDQLTTLESAMKKELAALKFLASGKKKTIDQRGSAQSQDRRRAKRRALPKV